MVVVAWPYLKLDVKVDDRVYKFKVTLVCNI